MAWRRPGDKPLSEPMMVSLPTHICVTWPQWVNTWWKDTSLNARERFWVWNFKGLDSTQNILPRHWKIWILYAVDILRAFLCRSPYVFWNAPWSARLRAPIGVYTLGPPHYMRCRPTTTGISMLKIRLSYDRLLFNMRIPIPGKDYLYIETGPLPHFPRYWPFVRGIHSPPADSPHKEQWCGALMFSVICARTNAWIKDGDAGDLRQHRARYDVTNDTKILLLAPRHRAVSCSCPSRQVNST